MNVNIVQNKYVNALLLLMLVSAFIHLFFAICIMVVTGNISFLNYFGILQIDYFLPSLVTTAYGTIASLAVVVLLYLGIIFYSRKT